MTAVGKLAASNLTVHRTRTLLTAAAIALSVSLVVAVTSGYATVENMAQRFVGRFMGTADAMLTKRAVGNESRPAFDASLVEQLRRDPDVKVATGRLEMDLVAQNPGSQAPSGHMPLVVGLTLPGDTRVESLTISSGHWFTPADGPDVAVVDQVALEKFRLKLGGTIELPSQAGPLRLRVVGVVQKPAVLATHIQSIYLPLATLQQFQFPGKPPMVNRVMVDLRPKANLDAFTDRWRPKLAAIDPDLTLRTGRDIRDRLDQNLQGVHLMSYLAGTVAMLAASFIIFSALSMGVAERTRTLAMLRAIGASRGQVARLVVSEGVLLAVVGVLVGIPLGYLWLWCVHLRFKEAVAAGLTLSPGGVAFAAVTSAAAAVIASLLPAWWATRVDPLEAMGPTAAPVGRGRGPLWAALIGLGLIGVDPLIIFGPWDRPLGRFARGARIDAHFTLGLPTSMIGFFLLGPVFVLVLERLAGPVVSRLAGVNPTLLRQQLSNGVWRAAGTCAALMVDLAVLISMEVEGKSMLSGWQLPDKFPDIFIVSWNQPVNADGLAKVEAVPGIVPTDVLPIALASPTYGNGGELALTMAALNPEGAMFFGIDPAKGMRMMELTFRQGTKAGAIAGLEQGRHVIITDELHQMRHLNVGDPMQLTTKLGKVDFTVAAVVYAPGIDLISSQFDMGRQFDQRTAGSIFGSYADAVKYFGCDGARVLAANLQPNADRDAVMVRVNKALNTEGMNAGDVRHIKEGMERSFGEVLLMVAVVPLGALAVASLGVTNTIMASVRVRRWQLGVLRSIGLTRGQLLRLVLGEAALVGVVGAALGLVAGAVLTMNSHGMLNVVVGYRPSIAVPWEIVGGGVATVLVVAVAAGVWPALSVARTSPLALLQGGRAAT